jgi:hypothetical protein
MPTENVLRHVVLFSFTPETTPDQVRAIEEAFASLPAQIPEIIAFEWGVDVSVENAARGYTHCFLVTFRNEAGRAIYLPHPAHQRFVELVGPHLAQVLVLDYWSQVPVSPLHNAPDGRNAADATA